MKIYEVFRGYYEECSHKVDASGHCMEPSCRNYAFYTGENARKAHNKQSDDEGE